MARSDVSDGASCSEFEHIILFKDPIALFQRRQLQSRCIVDKNWKQKVIATVSSL